MGDPPGSHFWRRMLTRISGIDKDVIATQEFRKANWVDYFGTFLQADDNLQYRTFDDLVAVFWNKSRQPNPPYQISTFVIADGAFVPQSTVGPWFKHHLRFLTTVTPTQDESWQLFIVGSGDLTSKGAFLQVASWDGLVLRFYAADPINWGDEDPNGDHKGWVYQGNSFDAFADDKSKDEDTSYLGPFDGHVNGALIMKELHDPWYHWLSGKNGDFLNCVPDDDKKVYEKTRYLTGSGQSCFSGASVMSADLLENSFIKDAVSNWYTTRLRTDLCQNPTATPKTPKQNPSNVRRWMSHFLLTTTINIQPARTEDGKTFTAPPDHFFNSELLSNTDKFNLLPEDMEPYPLTFDFEMYKTARDKLQLSFLQELGKGDIKPVGVTVLTLKPGTLGGGKETGMHDQVDFLEASPNNEGVPFVALQTSYEDAQGVLHMQNSRQFGSAFPAALISLKAARAILMLDFWNPVYSWRRGILMYYLPKVTTLSNKLYDLEANFVAAIRKSASVINKDASSPEHQFLQLYDGPDDVTAYQARFGNYLTIANKRVGTPEGLLDYLKLAESRRRIYRPLPLDEFGVQLPYAVSLTPDWACVEMTEKGQIQPIPTRGLDFFAAWTGSLSSYDPHLLPTVPSDAAPLVPRAVASRCPVAMNRAKGIKKRL